MKFSNSAPRDCADIAPQITALFDGEANSTQTGEARAHLLSCPACSRLWLDWTRHRDTLQSEPTPAVPPTLLWRVLIAYRVTAFARPARRRSRLPLVTATPLRGIEAPLPPRLSQHILARTTRKPNVHVMLTPLQGAPPAARPRRNWKERSFSFRHAPLLAAPALALWLLMLGRADFNANLPVATPNSAVTIAPAPSEVVVPATANQGDPVKAVATIPVASPSLGRAPVSTPIVATTPIVAPVVAAATPRERVVNRDESEVVARRVAPLASRAFTPAPRSLLIRADARAEPGLGRAFLLAINAGQSDITRARTVPVASLNTARPARVAPLAASIEAPESRPQTPAATPPKSAPRALRVARRAIEDGASSRVTLAALASPISPVRTISSARLRSAAFSEDAMRPRVAHLSADGRRLARLVPETDAASLRVSRPIAGAPTLREVSFGGADNGPKLDELRSAVDDFRASVAGDE